jgi:hypothetical protein
VTIWDWLYGDTIPPANPSPLRRQRTTPKRPHFHAKIHTTRLQPESQLSANSAKMLALQTLYYQDLTKSTKKVNVFNGLFTFARSNRPFNSREHHRRGDPDHVEYRAFRRKRRDVQD